MTNDIETMFLKIYMIKAYTTGHLHLIKNLFWLFFRLNLINIFIAKLYVAMLNKVICDYKPCFKLSINSCFLWIMRWNYLLKIFRLGWPPAHYFCSIFSTHVPFGQCFFSAEIFFVWNFTANSSVSLKKKIKKAICSVIFF